MEERIMGIFDTLKNAIFGSQPQPGPGRATATPRASQAAAPTARTAEVMEKLAASGGKVPDSLRH
jgi:hypothetical protein